MCGAMSLLPNTPPWCGAQLKHRDNFTFYILWTPVKLHCRYFTQMNTEMDIMFHNAFNPLKNTDHKVKVT
jgi:hypothetical protein